MPDEHAWLRQVRPRRALMSRTPPRTVAEMARPSHHAWARLFRAWLEENVPRGVESFDNTATHKAPIWRSRIRGFLADLDRARADWTDFEKQHRKKRDWFSFESDEDRERVFTEWLTRIELDEASLDRAKVEALACVRAFTTQVKPQYGLVCQAFSDAGTDGNGAFDMEKEWTGMSGVRAELDGARSAADTAEGDLRNACHPDANRAKLREAWAAYVEACTGMADAVASAATSCHTWAQGRAYDTIRGDFASHCPVTNGLLLGMEGLVAGMRVTLAAIGTTTPLIPLTTVLNTGLVVASDSLQEVVRRTVSRTASQDDAQVREVIGRKYVRPDDALLSGDTKERTEDLTRYAARAARTAADAVKAHPAATTGVKAVPFLGEVVVVGNFLVHLHEHLDRKVLQDGPHRARLLELFDTAARHSRGSFPSRGEVIVESFDPGQCTATVVLGGVRGELNRHGRFRPEDDSRVRDLVVRRWLKYSDGFLDHDGARLQVVAPDLVTPARGAADLVSCDPYDALGYGGYLAAGAWALAQTDGADLTELFCVDLLISPEGTATVSTVRCEQVRVVTPEGATIFGWDPFAQEVMTVRRTELGTWFDDLAGERGWQSAHFTAWPDGSGLAFTDEQGDELTGGDGTPVLFGQA
ncbi:hypothetical protein [Streptomyces sp. NPDC059918]|uniref:hypothetical protein n=1 Tax=unclassified Streptomyces TaxID=2593676 RepID=UPI00364ECA10